MSQAVRRHLRTGVTVASAGIVAAGLVALPPRHDVQPAAFQAVRLTAAAASAPAVTTAGLAALGTIPSRTSLQARSVAPSAASDETGLTTFESIGGALLVLGLIGVAAVGVLAGAVTVVVEAILYRIRSIFGRQNSALSAANSAAAVSTAPKASGRESHGPRPAKRNALAQAGRGSRAAATATARRSHRGGVGSESAASK